MTRKIRTPAELDALPQGVVLTSKGVSVAVKLADGLWGAAGFAGAIDSEIVARCAHGYLSIVGNISAPAPAPSAATARHERAVAYADDVAEGGAPVPDDYERHYCTDDGEDWPCGAARAARVPEAAVEAGARALWIEVLEDITPPGFAARQWDEGMTDREKQMRLARAALAAALPLLTAAPSATREEVARAIRSVTDRWDEPLDEVHDVPPIADALLARFTITPKEDR